MPTGIEADLQRLDQLVKGDAPPQGAKDIHTKLQVATVNFASLYNRDSTPGADTERRQAIQLHTLGVLLAARTQDDDLFENSIAQLRTFYADFPGCYSVDEKCSVVGLNLLRLLTLDGLADFHSELELLSPAELASEPVSFAVALEQHLAEGSYHRIIGAKAPSKPFACFMPKLADAVRADIANCSEVAYSSLELNSAQKLMFFASQQELAQYIQDNRPEWTVENGRIVFANVTAAEVEIPSMKLISQSLNYANELEKIV